MNSNSKHNEIINIFSFYFSDYIYFRQILAGATPTTTCNVYIFNVHNSCACKFSLFQNTHNVCREELMIHIYDLLRSSR